MAKDDRRSTRKLPRYASTFHAVDKWYKRMFEKLGWMILADAKGYNSKVSEYKKSIDRLIKTIEHLMTEYENHNRLHDLRVMLMNTKTLREHVERDFK